MGAKRKASPAVTQNAHGSCSVGFLVLVVLALSGCGSPNVASIEVRKKNQDLREEVESLKRAREGDAATIKALQGKVGTVPTLPEDRLAKLFTVHGLKLGRLTGGADLDREKPGDEGLKVYATPTDDEGEAFKAAGSFTVEAFDLADGGPRWGSGRSTWTRRGRRGTGRR
jgi:hypothetical protein